MRGELAEWSNAAVSKAVVGAIPPKVRILHSPPFVVLEKVADVLAYDQDAAATCIIVSLILY